MNSSEKNYHLSS